MFGFPLSQIRGNKNDNNALDMSDFFRWHPAPPTHPVSPLGETNAICFGVFFDPSWCCFRLEDSEALRIKQKQWFWIFCFLPLTSDTTQALPWGKRTPFFFCSSWPFPAWPDSEFSNLVGYSDFSHFGISGKWTNLISLISLINRIDLIKTLNLITLVV